MSGGGGGGSQNGDPSGHGGGSMCVVLVVLVVVVVLVLDVVGDVVGGAGLAVQSVSQPSPAIWLPSSQASASGSSTPSPQRERVASKRRVERGRFMTSTPVM